jgi:hypothetical protein
MYSAAAYSNECGRAWPRVSYCAVMAGGCGLLRTQRGPKETAPV